MEHWKEVSISKKANPSKAAVPCRRSFLNGLDCGMMQKDVLSAEAYVAHKDVSILSGEHTTLLGRAVSRNLKWWRWK